MAEWWERLGTGRLVGADAARRTPTGAACRAATASSCPGRDRRVRRGRRTGRPRPAARRADHRHHGTQEQIDTYVRDIVTGQQAWCQLFSEPGAGSDLAGLTAKAVKDGDEWIVTGQKVWTSLGQTADMGMLLARTDARRAQAPGHHLVRHATCTSPASSSARCAR